MSHGLTALDIARLAPSGFAHYASKGAWHRAKHLALIERSLMAAASGGRRILISQPPRSGKSEFVSKYFLAWYLGLNPNKRVLLASYEATFAASWGRKVRDLLTEHGEKVFGVKVRSDSKAADNWQFEPPYQGGMVSVGAGGSLTGRGADILQIDDPVKNAEDASSKRLRDKLWDWWQSTAYTRLEPGGSAIVIMTRWSSDDLVGRILQDMNHGGERWDVINIPAIAEENDPIGRCVGEALWPERYPIEALEQIKQAVGPRVFASLYQGDPRPAEGDIFKQAWFGERWSSPGDKHYSVPGSPPIHHTQLRRFAAVDLAMSTKTKADRTAIAVCGTMPDGRALLLDLIVGRFQGPDIVPKLRKVVDAWDLCAIGVEKNGLGIGVVQEAIRAGLPVKPIDSDQDKIARASYLATMLENGRFIFPQDNKWTEEAIAECLGFPNAQHDDIVDALAHAARMAKSYGGGDPPSITWPYKPNPLDGLVANEPWWGLND